jgi:Domain of unknown function (DUF6883)
VKLPNIAHAEIPERKLVDYLLSHEHHVGQGKAAFFAAFGFARERWRELAAALRAHAAANEVASTPARESGRLFVVEGPMPAPDGRMPSIRAVWCIDAGTEVPRLVTAYPLESMKP